VLTEIPSGSCSEVPPLLKKATSTTEQLKITKYLLRESKSSVSPSLFVYTLSGETTKPQPRLTLNSTFSLLAKKAGLKESPEVRNKFLRSIQEILIAEAEACRNTSSARKLNKTQLIKEFQKSYRNEDKNLQFLRYLIGKLLCVENLEPQTTSLGSFTYTRARRSTCPPRDQCHCPPGGILSELSCPCEFFDCLDQGNILRDLIFGFNVGDECLIFVIDTTGSMGQEINLAKRIVLDFIRIEEEIGPYGCYVLVPFNDIGPNHLIVAEESKLPSR